MANAIYRLTRPGDEKQLLEIWKAAYQGDIACAQIYFDQCYRPGDGIAAEADGQLCSAIYLLKGYQLHTGHPENQSFHCTYLYALGTPEKFRGHGYGGKTIWRSGVEGYFQGADFVCFVPASESLRRWYQNILGTRSVFYHRRILLNRSASISGIVTAVSSGEYLAQREQLLANHPHIEASESALKLQEAYCRLYGGSLWQFTLSGKKGICLGDIEDGTLTLRELLFPEGDPLQVGQLLMQHLNCHSAELRTPAFWHKELGSVQEDCILVPGGNRFPETQEKPFWGFAMD